MLSQQEKERYHRQLILNEWGEESQEKIKAAKILVVGAGGLGCPALQYLAAAGVGELGIVDFDTVEISNLHRQVLYTEQDVGKQKVLVAKEKLLKQNPNIHIETYAEQLSCENAKTLISKYNVVIDGTDQFSTRYLVNDACVLLKKPLIYASISKFEGQLSVFTHPGINLRDLFPEPPPISEVPSCRDGGVIGVLPGIMGVLQAQEAIKIVTGLGSPLTSKLLLYNALLCSVNYLEINPDPNNPLTGNNPRQTDILNNYEAFCGEAQNAGRTINFQEFEQWKASGVDFMLVDVREEFEYEKINLGGQLFPLSRINDWKNKLPRDKKVLIHCKAGIRSLSAIQYLCVEEGYTNLWNLDGIIDHYEVGDGCNN